MSPDRQDQKRRRIEIAAVQDMAATARGLATDAHDVVAVAIRLITKVRQFLQNLDFEDLDESDLLKASKRLKQVKEAGKSLLELYVSLRKLSAYYRSLRQAVERLTDTYDIQVELLDRLGTDLGSPDDMADYLDVLADAVKEHLVGLKKCYTILNSMFSSLMGLMESD